MLLSPVSPLYYKGIGQIPYPYSLYNKSAEKARVIFQLRRSDMIACAIVILKPYGFSDILFAIKLAKQIPLGASRISLRSNRTRRRRIKLPNFLMRSWANPVIFVLGAHLSTETRIRQRIYIIEETGVSYGLLPRMKGEKRHKKAPPA